MGISPLLKTQIQLIVVMFRIATTVLVILGALTLFYLYLVMPTTSDVFTCVRDFITLTLHFTLAQFYMLIWHAKVRGHFVENECYQMATRVSGNTFKGQTSVLRAHDVYMYM